MEIIQVDKPVIDHEGEQLSVSSYMFRDLIHFQSRINEMENKGSTKCYFYSLHTQHEKEYTLGEKNEKGVPELIYGDKDYVIYWVRCRFVK